MNTLRTSILIEADAREGTRAAKEAQLAFLGLRGKVDQLNRTTKSAAASADVFQRALDAEKRGVDQLRASMDPLFAATQRLKAGTDLVAQAQRRGAISAREQEQMLELLALQHRQTTAAITAQTAATRGLTTATNGGAGGIQNFSYQLQDIFTQVGMGVPLLISLGQQAPQILSGFGAVGAMAGVVAAGVLPLTAAVLGMGYGTRDTADEVKTSSDIISDALSAISAAQAVLRETSDETLDAVIAKYGEVTASVLTLMQAQADLATQGALEQTRTALESVFSSDVLDSITAEFERIPLLASEIEERLAARQLSAGILPDTSSANAELDALEQRLRDIRNLSALQVELGVDESTLQDIAIFRNGLTDALAAENFEGVLTIVSQLRETLQNVPDGPLQDMLGGVVDVEDALRQALAVSEDNEETQQRIATLLETTGNIDISSNLADGADQATRIANELSRAVTAAAQLANQGIGALDRARINFEFRDDPIGRAGALAGAEFDASTATDFQLPDGAAIHLREQRSAFIAARVEAAQYNEQLRAWQAEQREAARSGSGGGRGGAGAARRLARQAERDRERTITDIGRQMDRLAPSYERDAKALLEWRREALANLNPALAGYDAFAQDVESIFEQRLAEAYQEDLARQTDWRSGVQVGLSEIHDDLLSFADVSSDLVTTWASGLEDAFVEFGTTGKASIADLVDFTLEQLLRLSYQQALQPALTGLVDLAVGAFVPAGAPKVGPAATIVQGLSATQSHAGSTIGTGGVRRTYGAGAPLRADERLTVTKLGQRVFTPEQIANGATVVDALAAAAQSNRQGPANVTFSPSFVFENASGAPISGNVVEEDDGNGGRKYRAIIDDEIAGSFSRPGGGGRRAMQKQFGLRSRMPRR